MSFFWKSDRKAEPSAQPNTALEAAAELVAVSKVFPRLLSSLSQVDGPVIMDLGPVVGKNVAFLGDELGCTLLVQDAFSEVELCAKRGESLATGAAIAARLARASASVDAVLCWDLFDYLDRQSGRQVAQVLLGLLKPGGFLHAFFGQAPGVMAHHTRFIIESRSDLRLKTIPASPVPRAVYVTREIDKMLEGLVVVESVLLKTRSRETLFKKPA